jgi:hypothetical protein
MIKHLVLLLTVCIFSNHYLPIVPEVNPYLVTELNFNHKEEEEYNNKVMACMPIWDKLSSGTNYDDLSEYDKEVLSRVDEEKLGYWDVLGSGCSWYCGGGPKNVEASSHLPNQGSITYGASNAHDLNYKTAWVEGVTGYGVGEFLTYTFDGDSPRINEIIVVNGYVKSQAVWQDNSRVKRLKVFLDNKPIAILNLQNIRGEQRFKISPIGARGRESNVDLSKLPDWTLKFEIMEVYKGLRYSDVAITEIYFDGLDVHCFVAGTEIQMAGGRTKLIEEVTAGDSVVTFNLTTMAKESAVVMQTDEVVHGNLVTYVFDSGIQITATQDHPFMLRQKGWSSLKPKSTNQYKGFSGVSTIEVGDFFVTINGFERLKQIVYEPISQPSFTISKMNKGANFIANGFVVGVEELEVK